MVREVRLLMYFWGFLRVVFYGSCCLYCAPQSSSILLGTVLKVMLMILRYMQPFLDHFRVLKWLNYRKTKPKVVSRSPPCTPGYGDLTLGSAELEEIRSFCVIWATLNSKLTFESKLREVVSESTRSMGIERFAGNLIDCLRVLKSCFNAPIFSNLGYDVRV